MDSGKGFKQGKIFGPNICVLNGLSIKDDASNIFTCSTLDDCVTNLRDYHISSSKKVPSQEILEQIECLPRE